jgi:septum formation protein
MQPRIILASASPRRLHILQEHGFDAQVMPAHIEEVVQPGEDATTYVTRLAKEKGRAVLPRLTSRPADLVLSADTIVVYQNEILEKPKNAEDALRMLQLLSGKTHTVFTAYALFFLNEPQEIVDYVTTEITFHTLSDAQIQDYIDSGDPFDKAGAYGIQQVRHTFVKEIRGSYYNVVGLPIEDILLKIAQCKAVSL